MRSSRFAFPGRSDKGIDGGDDVGSGNKRRGRIRDAARTGFEIENVRRPSVHDRETGSRLDDGVGPREVAAIAVSVVAIALLAVVDGMLIIGMW